jgi:hypothetical protein
MKYMYWHQILKRLGHFQQYFSYIVAVSFIGGGNQSTRRKPQTCRWQTLSHNVDSNTPRHEWGCHLDTLFWFWANQLIPIVLTLVGPDQGSIPRSPVLEASMLTITPPMWLKPLWDVKQFLYYWLARNQDNVSKWGDMSIRRLLFQWDSTIKIKQVCCFIQNEPHHHVIATDVVKTPMGCKTISVLKGTIMTNTYIWKVWKYRFIL